MTTGAIGGLSAAAGLIGALRDARNGVADPSDTSLQARINRGLCDIWASNPTAASLATGLAGGAVANELCGKYWDGEGAPPPSLEPPFEGGQCLVPYSISGIAVISEWIYEYLTGTPDNGTSVSDNEFANRWTVGSVPGVNQVSLQVVGERQFNQSGLDGALTDRFFWGTNNSSPALFIAHATPLIASGLTITGGSAFVNKLDSLSNPSRRRRTKYIITEVKDVVVTRQDGLPDNCGSPPPVWLPSPNYPRPRPFGSPTDIGTPGSPDPWIYLPGIDARGEPYIRVEPAEGNPVVGLPDIWLPGGFTPPDFGGEPPAPTAEGEPEDVLPGGDGGELDEPVPPPVGSGSEARCIGYRWELSNFPSGDSIVAGSNRVLPYIAGNLQLKLKGSGSTVFRSDNLRLYSSQGTIVTPDDSLRVVGIAFTKRRDLRLRLFPLFVIYRREILEV